MILTSVRGGVRIDLFLAKELTGISRARIQRLLTDGHITLNGEKIRPSYKLKEDDILEINIPEPKVSTVKPENIPLDIIFEDEQIIVVNKSAGMVTHPAAGNWNGTLVGALMGRGVGLSGIGGVTRPGIVHRLDKGTSGVIVAAKNDHSHASLSNQIKKREMERQYLAVVKGKIKVKTGEINKNIGRSHFNRKKMAIMKDGGRVAITKYRVLQELDNATLLEVSLKTGRTHQIRVHMFSIRHPVIGDIVYGGSGLSRISRQALHAWKLKLIHPTTGKVKEFIAPLPTDMFELIGELGGAPQNMSNV
ncbi:MAG TPA: RluA family pseudouridine synthase [Nitrospinota bacterium]|nr:RluA family pseudouridine synthase [Nitrospinota bacterium]|tara:strand:+ start:153984 stop:154901 length:918 start_codon:yes stop_codon:yes gene_type:complete